VPLFAVAKWVDMGLGSVFAAVKIGLSGRNLTNGAGGNRRRLSGEVA